MAIRKGYRGKPRKPTRREFKMNQEIKAPEVRVLDEDKSQIGVMSLQEALQIAEDKGLDLIEIVPKAKPPVCQVISHKKYLYQQKKKEKEKQKKQKETQVQLKSMRFGANTEEHDYNFKLQKIRDFLEDNNKVQVFVLFKGRQMIHKDRGYKLLENIAEDIKDLGQVERRPKMAGNRLTMIVGPYKKDK
jgi:translation initiation factor IF-3